MGDVAAAAGVKLSEAEAALQALAYDAQAVLQVCGEGGEGRGGLQVKGEGGSWRDEGDEVSVGGGSAGFHTGQIV